MQPGSDIRIAPVISPEMCSKCHAKFVRFSGSVKPRIDPAWCDQCNADPTSDWMDDEFWRTSRNAPYILAGWKFARREDPVRTDHIYLLLYKKLPYPEAPGLDRSYATGPVGNEAHLAAWLIGHWYEHLLNICPCQNGVRDESLDAGDGSPFRQAVIKSLLWYRAEGLV